MAFVARLTVLLAVIGCVAAAPAHAQDEDEPRDVIERTWFIDGGEVLVERAGDGRFVGTVLEPTRRST